MNVKVFLFSFCSESSSGYPDGREGNFLVSGLVKMSLTVADLESAGSIPLFHLASGTVFHGMA